MTLLEYVLAGIVLVLVVAGAAVTLVRGRTLPPPSRRAPTEVPTRAPTETPVQPSAEAPESAQGRLLRLRSRLARSQSSLGRGLLALLSRDTLDDDVWESVEDTLIGADIGVAPAQDVVARLRTRLRGETGITAADVHRVLR